MITFKIRDTNTELYSTGGYAPEWNSTGKTWKTLKGVIAHLKLYSRGKYPGERKKVPASWEIVEFQMRQVSVQSARDLVKPV